MNKKYKNLLFDLDNTLIDDNANRKYAIKKIIIEKNGKVSEKELDEYIKFDNQFWRDRASGKIKDPYEFGSKEEKTKWIRSYKFVMFFKDISLEEGSIMNEKYIKYLNEEIIPVNGANTILEYLYNKGYKIYVITNSPITVANSKVNKSGIKKYIRSIFTAEEAGFMKPHNGFFSNFSNKIENIYDSLIIGDELGQDVALGINHGIDTCWLNTNNIENKTNYKPNYEIKYLEDLKKIL